MPTHHFITSDYLAIVTAFCLFALIAFLPGYALGHLTNVLRFRARTLAFRLAASVPLSVAVGPILAYTIGRWISMTAVMVVYGAVSAVALYLIVKAIRKVPFGLAARTVKTFAAMIGVWLIIALGSLSDLQIGKRLYFSIITFDYAVRVEFTQAISTFGLPAHNPFFFPGHEATLRYHYFWILLCSLVQRLGAVLSNGGVDARHAFIAGTIWSGIALICLIPIYLRIFSPLGAANLPRRRSLIAIALLGVTGLDILGALFMLWLAHIGLIRGVSPSVEWWNEQVTGWMSTMLWEPHYLCSLIACLAGFLILWDSAEETLFSRRFIAAIVAGLAFASAVGSGIYVAMVFAAFLGIWTVVTLAKRWYREAVMLTVSGLTAGLFAIPYLKSLAATKATGGQLLTLTIRQFVPAELFMKLLRIDRPWQLLTADLITLPLNYFLELGVFAVAAYLTWKQFRNLKRSPTRQELAAFIMTVSCVAICTFVKSSVISNNDLGWRGFLVAQFMLLLCTADLLSKPGAIPHATRPLVALTLALGVIGVAYDLAILRFFPVLSDYTAVPKIYWLADDEQLGRRTYDNREAYEWLRARTSNRAIIQQNPDVSYQDSFYGLYGQRQTVAADKECGTGFGGDHDECQPIHNRLNLLYARRKLRHTRRSLLLIACRLLRRQGYRPRLA